ncbi:MAG: hypothetical protein IMF14_00775 [Proteobacteria bacterium]|nr:hypothetical protein [Pseudomonadota bacterium]
MNRYLISVSILLLLCLSPVAEAGCDIDELDGSMNKVGKLYMMYDIGDCYGGENDANVLTKAVRDDLLLVKEKPSSEAELREQRDQLLAVLSSIEGSLSNMMSVMDGQWQVYARITIAEMGSAKNELRNFDSTIRTRYWFPHQDYSFFEQQETGKFLIDYAAEIDAACPSAGIDERCRAALQSQIILFRHIELVRQVLANPVREKLQAIHEQLVQLDAEWEYYFEDARSQFWWEFMANNAIYDPAGDTLARPPAGQLIFMHFNAAVEYVSNSENVDRAYNLVGIVELVGYNRLRWKDKDAYSKWPVGMSVIATYVPATKGDDFGYGLMAHVKNEFSFGATRRDTGDGAEITWLFSIDLSKLFLEKSVQVKKQFRSLR